MDSRKHDGPPPPGTLERWLSVFADVRAGEGATALLLTSGLFLLLMAWYIIKPIRDSIITGPPHGAEYKAWMSSVIAVTLLFAVPAYARFASRLPRNRLLVGVTAFFVTNLLLFYVAGLAPWTRAGTGQLVYALALFLWAGVFNMMIVAQYWAFANDVYTQEQGKRLFPLVGIGGTVGAALGSLLLYGLVQEHGTMTMLPLAGAVLASSGLIIAVVHARESKRAPVIKADSVDTPSAEPHGAFALVFKHRYLLLVALFATVFTFVNTNSEYVKDQLIRNAAETLGASRGLDKSGITDLRTKMIGEFFLYVNVGAVLLQSFVVSRVVKALGLRGSFFLMPAVAFMDAAVIALVPVWSAVRFGKVAENATDYSLNNTVRHMLWLPTTRRQKYVAKQAVDTFFVRGGDVLSGVAVFVLTTWLQLSLVAFAVLSLVMVVVWVLLGRSIVAENARLSREEPAAHPISD
jgi:AAA family ATP:ADP antiporter